MTVSETKTVQVCLMILTVIATAFALTYTKFMLVPLVFSIFTYATFAPLIQWLQVKLRIPKFFAITFTLLSVLLLSVSVVFMFLPSIKQIFFKLNNYETYLTNIVDTIEASLPGIQIDAETIYEKIQEINPLTHIRNITGQTLLLLGNFILVLVYTAFLLVGESSPKKMSPFIRTILLKISEYTYKKSILAMSVGFCYLIILSAFRVELIFALSIAAVFLNFIPTLGSIIALLLPLPVLFYGYGFEWQFFLSLGLLATVQFFIGNVIEPYVLGEIMDLHPITVLICLVFWGLIWGLAGMFLAVPITAVLKIVFARIETTSTFAELLAGRISSKEA